MPLNYIQNKISMSQSFFSSHLSSIIYGSTRDATIYLRQKMVLRNDLDCSYCGIKMVEIKKANAIDEYVFKCYNNSCQKFKNNKID